MPVVIEHVPKQSNLFGAEVKNNSFMAVIYVTVTGERFWLLFNIFGGRPLTVPRAVLRTSRQKGQLPGKLSVFSGLWSHS